MASYDDVERALERAQGRRQRLLEAARLLHLSAAEAADRLEAVGPGAVGVADHQLAARRWRRVAEDAEDVIRRIGPPDGSASGSGRFLTEPELRVLGLLDTDLSFAEIGGRLGASAQTVRTRAISIYRVLGVVSRAEAVECARTLGTLPRTREGTCS